MFPCPVSGVRLVTLHLALCRPMLADYPAHPALGHQHHAANLVDTASSPRGAQKFPLAAS